MTTKTNDKDTYTYIHDVTGTIPMRIIYITHTIIYIYLKKVIYILQNIIIVYFHDFMIIIIDYTI